jgi:hypothetical protein
VLRTGQAVTGEHPKTSSLFGLMQAMRPFTLTMTNE